MTHKGLRHSAFVAVALTAALGASACSGSAGRGAGSDTKPRAVPAVKGEGKTLTVWVMDGDYSDATLKAMKDQLTRQTGAEAKVEVQNWDGITTKITTALATSTPPDVIDIGNTQVASFAASGGLMDLTPYTKDFRQGQSWLAGLEEPATVDGRLYAVPSFAGARAVIYNKKIWAAAGVKHAPATLDELTSALRRIRAANPAPDFSPFYLPGRYWHTGVQFVWDAGGDIAAKQGSTWKGALGTEAAQRGLNAYRQFQNEFSAPSTRTIDTLNPDQTRVFADGKAAAISATNATIALIKKANPSFKDSDMGTFPFPGRSGTSQPVMLGGSDWAVAAKSAHADLALQWVKIATAPTVQKQWVAGHDGWIPNSTGAVEAARDEADPLFRGFFDAALRSKATPAAADWAELEGNKDIDKVFSSIASGTRNAKQAADTFDETVGKVLNARH
ncbi:MULTISPECIES: extracellular solute-binding protein [unclassified Streptomyces]|uniref:extracellular solute-binding protein n=1 Tax=unclassified Streptomyces TaxID=2593676 RepID=UPI00081B1109|nr:MULTISPECIES: extracellular solute-binding protein [unclassified Streptomyces]MYQ82340.1 extracellular solute-binding protein [Streptomyces sp. SID4936]SCD34992.1 carbohydrate ABC transporter substrate-binding protein, CUT1 family [Streptomyces sp. DvalAA-43]